jgi:hypothetical protein
MRNQCETNGRRNTRRIFCPGKLSALLVNAENDNQIRILICREQKSSARLNRKIAQRFAVRQGVFDELKFFGLRVNSV